MSNYREMFTERVEKSVRITDVLMYLHVIITCLHVI